MQAPGSATRKTQIRRDFVLPDHSSSSSASINGYVRGSHTGEDLQTYSLSLYFSLSLPLSLLLSLSLSLCHLP